MTKTIGQKGGKMFNFVTKGLQPEEAQDVWRNYICKGKTRADWERGKDAEVKAWEEKVAREGIGAI